MQKTGEDMTVRIRVSDSDCVENLAHGLRSAGCAAVRESGDVLAVVHVEAADALEARLEIEFFLRAWQLAYPGVQTELIA
jgi:hypothetical protein